MSKRKLPESYSSLRRQTKAQVDADLQFIASSTDVQAGESSCSVDQSLNVVNDLPNHNWPVVDFNLFCFDDDNDDDECSKSQYIGDTSMSADPSYSKSDTYLLPCLNIVSESFDCHWVDSDPDDEEDYDCSDNINMQLSEWAVKNSISMLAIGELLSILKPHFSSLPSDPRTFLKTPRSCKVKKLKNGGEYCHLGLETGLVDLFKNGLARESKCLELQFNVDGVPLFKSSNACLWPILCMVKQPDFGEPFVVGIYKGNEKPASACEFLSDFVAETVDLVENGLTVLGNLYTVKIHSFVCDAPARAFMKGVKCHSGYAACEKCTEHGEYDGKVIFPTLNAPLRTDQTFNDMTDEDHHMEPCPLKPLSVGCVSQFGLDYMHLVCLGVVRRLILYWKGPVGPLQVRLGSRLVSQLSQKLLSLSENVPCEFARKPRSVAEVLRWKATEFRQFLLYTGPVVLKDILPETLYHHFLLLSLGIRILACPKFVSTSNCCDYANKLLVLFVSEAEKLYGREIYVYNIHSLIHLTNDVKNLGALDNFSCFPFENKLGQLKKLIRKPQFLVQQLVKRLAEKEQVRTEKSSDDFKKLPSLKNEHHNGPILSAYVNCRQYKHLQTDRHTISITTGNNCIMTSNGFPALVRNILDKNGTVLMLCEKFITVEDAFDYPLSSSKLGICKVANKMTDLFAITFSNIQNKCVLLPLDVHEDNFVVFPLLH